MDNAINIKGERHLLAYCVGLLVGMGIEYRVNYDSELYTITKERQRERHLDIDKDNGDLIEEEVTPDGVTIFAGKRDNLADCKLNVYVRGNYA